MNPQNGPDGYREKAITPEEAKKYRMIVDLMSDYIFSLTVKSDGSLTLDFVTENYPLLTAGRNAAGIRAQDQWINVIHPDDRPLLGEKIAHIMKTGETISLECRSFKADGSMRWVHIAAKPEFSGGRIIAINGAVSDISERKRMENELLESHRELDRFFMVSPDIFCIADHDGRLRRLNDQWKEVLGFGTDELAGRDIMEFIHHDDLQASREAMEQLHDGRPVHDFVCRMRTKSGGYRWFEWRAVAGDENIFAAARDITGRIAHERKLRLALEEKDFLMKELEHRVKNNMMTIISLLNLEADRRQDNCVREILAVSRDRIQTMMIVYEKLYRSGSLSMIDLKDYLTDLLHIVFDSYALDRTVVTMDLKLEHIEIDQQRAVSLGLIVNELMTNSMKYAFFGRSEGRISVCLRRDAGSIVFSFSDDGIGRSEVQPPDSEKGFGLQLVGLKVEELEGTMTMHRGPGMGITITLPCVPSGA